MTKLRDEGVMTDDPVVKAMFKGVEVRERIPLSDVWTNCYLIAEDIGFSRIIYIPYSAVWAAIQPVEGEGCIEDGPGWAGYLVVVTYDKLCIESESDVACYHKRVLNIVTTRSELRDLVRRCKEAL